MGFGFRLLLEVMTSLATRPFRGPVRLFGEPRSGDEGGSEPGAASAKERSMQGRPMSPRQELSTDAAIVTIVKTSRPQTPACLPALAAVSPGTDEAGLVRVLRAGAAHRMAQHARARHVGKRKPLARRSN